MQGKDTGKPIPPVHDSNNIILMNDSDMAEAVNDYFANIGIQLAEKFVHDSSAMADQSLETLYRVTPTKSQIASSEKEVKLRLTGIKQKTQGPDKKTSREMAEAAETQFEDLSLQHFQK